MERTTRTAATEAGFDLIAIEETMLRLSVPRGRSLESNPVGRGDAFVASFLHSLQSHGNVACGLAYGVVFAALNQTHASGFAWIRRADVDETVPHETTAEARPINRRAMHAPLNGTESDRLARPPLALSPPLRGWLSCARSSP